MKKLFYKEPLMLLVMMIIVIVLSSIYYLYVQYKDTSKTVDHLPPTYIEHFSEEESE